MAPTAVPPTEGPAAQPAAPPPAAPHPRKPPNNLVGLAVLAAFAASGYGLARGETTGPLTFAFVMLGWVLSVMAHEFSHALVAWLGGDWTVRDKGYLAFDPRRYGDVGVSLVLPLLFLALGGIGFPGGAVFIAEGLMRNRLWRSASALAGPAATFVVLMGLGAYLRPAAAFGLSPPLYAALTMLAFLQATALILNLLPLPGLDGFAVIRPWLPPALAPHIRKAEGIAMALLFILLMITPNTSLVLFHGGAALMQTLGLSTDALGDGWRAFHFWRG